MYARFVSHALASVVSALSDTTACPTSAVWTAPAPAGCFTYVHITNGFPSLRILHPLKGNNIFWTPSFLGINHIRVRVCQHPVKAPRNPHFSPDWTDVIHPLLKGNVPQVWVITLFLQWHLEFQLSLYTTLSPWFFRLQSVFRRLSSA